MWGARMHADVQLLSDRPGELRFERHIQTLPCLPIVDGLRYSEMRFREPTAKWKIVFFF
jgi:hypothetical protein